MKLELAIDRIDILNLQDISKNEKEIEAKILTSHTDVEYAWYLYRDGKRIEMKWYSVDQQTIKIKLIGEGEYHLKGYIRDWNGNKTSVKSKKILIGEKKISLHSLRKKELTYEKLKKTSFNGNLPTIYTVKINGLQYDFLLKVTDESPNLTVLGTGASSLKPPVFNRFSWMNEIEGNVLYYSDPTLHLANMRVGYGLGIPKEHALERIAEITLIIAKSLKVKNKNILFFGSSAGGFKSLMLGGYVKDSSVFINNPVTIASNSAYFNKLDKILRTETEEFKGYNPGEIKHKYINRVDVREFYKTLDYIPNIYYLQNAACKNDIHTRFLPFVSFYEQLSIKELNNQFITDLYWDEEAQHNPVSKEKTLMYIEKVRQMWAND